MTNPEISIVFTSYNHKEYLGQALDSLLAQTFTNYELIVVDDCSTDGSQEVLREYAKKDDRIKLTLNSHNSGSYVHSTNQGASLAIAPYVIFAQCDDWAEPHQLEKLLRSMKTNNVSVVFSCSNMVDESGMYLNNDFNSRGMVFKKRHSSDSIIESQEAISYLMESCMIPNLSAALIKKSLYSELNGLSTDYLVLADWDFWLRSAIQTDFYYIREPLNNFRQHSNTIRSSIKIKKQITEVFNMLFSFSKNTGFPTIKCCHAAANIWIHWALEGKMQWLRSFPSIMREALRKSGYMIIAFPIELIRNIAKKSINLLRF